MTKAENIGTYSLEFKQSIKYEDIKPLLKGVDDFLFVDKKERLELCKETLKINESPSV